MNFDGKRYQYKYIEEKKGLKRIFTLFYHLFPALKAILRHYLITTD